MKIHKFTGDSSSFLLPEYNATSLSFNNSIRLRAHRTSFGTVIDSNGGNAFNLGRITHTGSYLSTNEGDLGTTAFDINNMVGEQGSIVVYPPSAGPSSVGFSAYQNNTAIFESFSATRTSQHVSGTRLDGDLAFQMECQFSFVLTDPTAWFIFLVPLF